MGRLVWRVERTNRFVRSYTKLSSDAQMRCDAVIDELACSDNPRMLGDRMVGDNSYKYRFGDYRLIYGVTTSIMIIDLLDVGKRSRIY